MKLLNKVKSILLIIFFMTLIFAGKSFAVTGEITEITVNLRKEPSTSSKKIMYVTQDDIVEVLEKDGEWYKIKFKGKTGYVFGKYLKVDDSKLENTDTKKEEKVETTEKETNTKTEETPQKEDTKNDVQDVTIDVPADLQIKEKTDIRLIPNITSSVIYTAKKAISIQVIEQLSEWSYISVDNVTGWVRTDKIVEKNVVSADKKEDNTEKREEEKTSNSEVKETKTAYIKYDKVNLRKKASTSSTVLAKLKLNDKVTVLEEVDSKWSKVKIDGITGYISTELLSDKKQEVKEEIKEEENTTSRDGETTSRKEKEEVKEDTKTETKQEENKTTEKNETIKEENKNNTSSKVTGADIVAYAKKYLGYDYVLGGASPKSGFDCSGFTRYVYNHFGYKISRTSKTQAKDGKEVAKSDLQPGDIIIFKNQALTAIGHVGIYIGNNKIIHASEPGVGVIITSMNASGYNYNKRYVTARRII